MKKLFFIGTTVLLCSCFSAKLLTPSEADVTRVKDKFPTYTLTELNQGKTLFQQHCGQCHGLKNPASRTEEQWKEIVPRMTKKVNKKENNVLDAAAQEQILKYVITMSSAPKGK